VGAKGDPLGSQKVEKKNPCNVRDTIKIAEAPTYRTNCGSFPFLPFGDREKISPLSPKREDIVSPVS